MNNWKVISATAVIFGAGVITGGLLVNYAHNSKPAKAHKAAVAHPSGANPSGHSADAMQVRAPEMLSRQFLQRLDEGLHLSADQHGAIQKIIADGQNLMRKVIFYSRLEIRDILAPEQQKQFDEMVKRPLRRAIFNTNAPPPNAP